MAKLFCVLYQEMRVVSTSKGKKQIHDVCVRNREIPGAPG